MSSTDYPLLSWDGLDLDVGRRTVIVGGVPQRLTPLETHILAVLMESHGRAVSCNTLYERAWGEPSFSVYATQLMVKNHITHLRQKIGSRIKASTSRHAQHDGGYYLVPEGQQR